jgi:hypothetical protein
MRYFRKRVRPKLSAKAFGELYGKEINADGSAVGERWILDMELNNKVPVDMNKRRTIARLLGILPMLFGLATLEDIVLTSHTATHQITDIYGRLLASPHKASQQVQELGDILRKSPAIVIQPE